MIKMVSIYSIPEGTNPDEFWMCHTEIHAKDVKKAAGPSLKKYVINRVIKVRRGEPKFFGLIEQWTACMRKLLTILSRLLKHKTPWRYPYTTVSSAPVINT